MGGWDGGSTYYSSCEFYDPQTGTFSPGPPMGAARAFHSATLMPNNRVLITGGFDGTNALDSTEIFDLTTNTFSPGPKMSVARYLHTATQINGRVFVAGGFDNTGVQASAEILDASRIEITGNLATQNYPGFRAGQGATLLLNGQLLITGGLPVLGANSRIAEIYIPQ